MVTQNIGAIHSVLPTSLPIGPEHVQCDRIYTDFFNLKEAPFSITPDPEFLFLSETHRNVIEKIQYGIQARLGFMVLAGEVGTGKTTLCRALLDHLQDSVRTVYVINPSLESQELLAGILDDLGISYSSQSTKKELMDQLNRCLLDNDDIRPVVIIVDDAQTMPLATLEDLRLLSNLETDKSKLLHMLLVGQPELLDHLNQPQMRQLKQRVAVSCHLDYLSSDEVGGYIERRLFIAGNQGQLRFSPKAIRQVHKQSGGVPRMINKICDLALTAAYADNSNVVEKKHLRAAASELIERQGIRGGYGFIKRFFNSGVWMTSLAVSAILGAMIIGDADNDDVGSNVNLKKAHLQGIESTQPPKVQLPDQSQTTNRAGTDITPAQSQHGMKAYILQLGSFNTLATTLRAVDIYRQKGIETHWNAVQLDGKGLWYRVFTGRFTSIDAARQFQHQKDVRDAQILFAPWSVVVDHTAGKANMAEVRDRLQFEGVDSYIAPSQNGISLLCAGAFVSQVGADEMARQIYQLTGVTTRVESFDPSMLSRHSGDEEIMGGGPS